LLSIGQYELLVDRLGSKKIHEVTYRATLTNTGPSIRGAVAIARVRGKVKILDGTLTFPAVTTGGSALSIETHDLSQ